MPDEPSGQYDDRKTGIDTTCWSVVIAAGLPSPESKQALATLCEKYWFPVYAFVRRKVGDIDQAQDLTQEFFATLLEKNYVADADPERGRFRAFLFAAVNNFLSKQWAKQRTVKRGGATRTLVLDFNAAEVRYRSELADHSTPEKRFQQIWVRELASNALGKLERESAFAGNSIRFHALKPFLVASTESPKFEKVATRLGLAPGTVRVAVHRLKKRYGELIRLEIAETVDTATDIEEEINELFAAFS